MRPAFTPLAAFARRLRPGIGARQAQHGFSLIELLVAVVIGMALTIAITVMLARQEAGRRTTTAVNDAFGGGAYVSYLLDRTLRGAGSGFVQGWNTVAGCRLGVSRSGTRLLPRSNAFPAPFDGMPQTLRLAPVIVHAGIGPGGSDVLAVAAGASGLGESPLRVLANSATTNQLRVPSNLGLQGGDLVLVGQGGAECLLQQVEAGFNSALPPFDQIRFGGAYAASGINGVDLASFGTGEPAVVAPIGNVAGNQPQLLLIGIGPNATLQSLDLLRLDGSDTPVPLADGVAELHALYGVDTSGDGRVDDWVAPDQSPWTAAELNDGTPSAQQRLRQIRALRIGLMLRTSVPERQDVSPASLVLFGDLPAALRATRAISGVDARLRWRTLDFTVPLRNVMLAP